VNQINFAGRSDRPEQTEGAVANSPTDATAAFEAPTPVALTPLIGRDAELSVLKIAGNKAKKEGAKSCCWWERQAWANHAWCRRSGDWYRRMLAPTLGQRLPTLAALRPVTRVLGHRMALFATFPELGTLPGFRFYRAHPRARARPITNRSLRSTGTAFGRLWSGSSGGNRLFAKLLFLPPDERYLATDLTPAREREETFHALHRWLAAYSAKRRFYS